MVLGVFRFKIWKKSISTTIAVAVYSAVAYLFYFGYLDAGIIIVTAGVYIMLFRSMTRAETDTISTNRYKGKDRRNVHNN
jgi:dolichol kinase